MKQTDALVLGAIADQVLSVDVLEEIVQRTLAAAAKTNPAEHLDQVQREIRSVETQVHRYVEAIGRSGDIAELASALKRAQARRGRAEPDDRGARTSA